MKQLFSIDLKDYSPDSAVSKRPSARGIIFRDGLIALVYSKKEKYYKFPGGGIRDGEDKKEALIREVLEETGLTVIPESIREFGSVIRRQNSNLSAGTVFEQENFYYFCDVRPGLSPQKLDEYEDEAGFILKFVKTEEAIEANRKYHSNDLFDEIMIKREMKVLELIRACAGGCNTEEA